MKIKKIFFEYLLTLIFVLAVSQVLGDDATNREVKCIEMERRALLNFKQSLVVECFEEERYCGKVASWNTSEEEDCCKWQGIKCSNLTGHITALDLSGQDLRGLRKSRLVSPSLLELKQLKYLDLSFNSFTHIPKFIGSLTELRYLNLGFQLVTIRLPPQLGNLTKLQFLSLEECGIIENLEWLPNLASLKYLHLSQSNLENCSWLEPISKLSSLTELYLDNCGLTEKSFLSLPLNNSSSMPPLSSIDLSSNYSDSLLELKQLNYLDLSYNYFTHIPKFIGSLTELRYLNLGFQRSPVGLPPQIGNLTKVQFLFLEGFNTIKNLEWLPNLVSLKYLHLGHSNLENCSWLEPISKLSSLTELYLDSCGLPGKSSLSLPLNNSSSMPPLSFIDLSYNHFNSSSSFDWLLNLTNRGSLVELYLTENSLGYVPEAIGHLVSLETLDLSFCNLHGEIPKSFSNLHHLRSLNLNCNAFSMQLPELFHALAAAEKSLEYLSLNTNEFTGSLPDFTRFPLLRELYLFGNKLNGTFPESFGHISSLVYLDLTDHHLTGPLPDLAFLPSLRELRLGGNNLSGNIPESFGQLSKLEIFEAYSNSFEGTISEAHLSNLSKLNVLDLSWNSLSFKLSSSWTPPFQLEIIKLTSCKLGTHFPNWLQSQKNYSVLDISNAKISDTAPRWFWDLPQKLLYLNVSNNQINGQIGNLTSKFWENFECLDLSSNHFHGSIPELPRTLVTLDISKNMLTGQVPSLCPNFLLAVDASDNLLSGKLPDCWTQGPQFLNLANNNLSGEIQITHNISGKVPAWIGNSELFVLQLRNNSFTGEFPLALMNCTNLLVLDLSLNKLSGKVPAWIAIDFKELIVLSLRGNEFHGAIPPEICQLTSLQFLDISQNSISGNLPTCINNLSSMVFRNVDRNSEVKLPMSFRDSLYLGHFVANVLVQWKKKDSEYKKTLGLLTCIDLSSNKLVGNIPPEFASLGELVSLNLSKNNLSGNIFKNIGEMKMLESLDFSYNHLSGKIPNSLSRLGFLSVLDLSNNNLSGKIPQSTQLQTFDASTYTGNPKLCGPPLLIKCPGDEPTLVPPSIDDGKANVPEDEDRFINTGFYISVTLGFIIGFWGFCGPLLLKRRWRYTYFNKLMKIFNWVYVMAKVKKETLLRKLRR